MCALLLAVLGAGMAPALMAQADESAQPATQSQQISRAVMTGEQVIQILDETVDWYRTLGLQQQSATQPSDLLILYANRQTADKVIDLAFEIARANAELLSSEAELKRSRAGEARSSFQALQKSRQELDAKRQSIQSEIASVQREIPRASNAKRNDLRTKLSELQSELDLVNARRNLLATMSQHLYQSDADGSGASTLKQHIDAIAASIPSSAAMPAPDAAAAAPAAAAASESESAPLLGSTSDNSRGRLGIWDLAANVWRLQEKISTIDAVDERTAQLQEIFREVQTRPQDQVRALSERGDSLAQQANSADNAVLRGVRDQFDTLAWLFKQTSSILIPLNKAGVLLDQYRHNLSNWREVAQNQYRDALGALARRVALLLVLLAIVFASAEVWKRVVFRYVQESRKRYQFLLVRKIVLWALVVAIVGFTFATELGSLATFAGLITAGLAVAMQSVLVSFVGYFFLIGKYGIRVGDRVQIGSVTGEVIDLGLVRLHLMELSGQGPFSPTGRVVAFANSIVFQASGGIFKQIPGVNLAWHEVTLTLPQTGDYSALKEKLIAATRNVLEDYHEDLLRQTKEIQRNASSSSAGDAQPQVQLKFSPTSVEAVVRYPVQLQRAAEIDERVSRELLNVIRSEAA